jgi:hypothetical protein
VTTDCIRYISLLKSEREWAKIIMLNLNAGEEKRKKCGQLMEESNFNIFKESIRFKKLLYKITKTL